MVHGLASHGAGAPGDVRLVVAACRLSWSAACGILVPNQGSNPHPLHCKAGA